MKVNPALTRLFLNFFSFAQLTFSQNVFPYSKTKRFSGQVTTLVADVFLNGFLKKCSRFPRNSINQVDFNESLREIRSSGHSPPHLGTFSLSQVAEWRPHFSLGSHTHIHYVSKLTPPHYTGYESRANELPLTEFRGTPTCDYPLHKVFTGTASRKTTRAPVQQAPSTKTKLLRCRRMTRLECF